MEIRLSPHGNGSNSESVESRNSLFALWGPITEQLSMVREQLTEVVIKEIEERLGIV